MQYGCIGEHLSHSFSKEIHESLASYPYEIHEVAKQDLAAFMTEKNFCGINVTIPYKQAVIPFLTDLSPEARAIGAVNTVVNRDGALYGYNTDFVGMKNLIEHTALSLQGKKVMILGSGGTSLTAHAVANAMGAASVCRVSRTQKTGCITYEEALTQTGTNILINTTPCGMFPHAQECPIDITAFPALEGVIDAIYHPLRTVLVSKALQKGICADGGLYMLVAQAVAAAEIFSGKSFPADTTDRVYEKIRANKENIVLIGMPGSGKSTVANLLSEQTGRPFFDSDDEIVKQAGMSIPDIFAKEGEAGFRARECAVIQTLSQKTGCIIATGGGTVLNDDNVAALKRNGRLFWLDRPLADLVPTPDRPLSSDTQALVARYHERLPRYQAVADVTLSVTGTPEQVLALLHKKADP